MLKNYQSDSWSSVEGVSPPSGGEGTFDRCRSISYDPSEIQQRRLFLRRRGCMEFPPGRAICRQLKGSLREVMLARFRGTPGYCSPGRSAYREEVLVGRARCVLQQHRGESHTTGQYGLPVCVSAFPPSLEKKKSYNSILTSHSVSLTSQVAGFFFS